MSRVPLVFGVLGLALAACTSSSNLTTPTTVSTGATAPTTNAASTTTGPPETETSVPAVAPGFERPAWLGTRILDVDPDTGFGVIPPTPPELVDRRFQAPDHLPPPTSEVFAATVVPVPDDVLARSTWDPACPVTRDDLRYVTFPFWGFDGRLHTGELLINADTVTVVVTAFERIHEARLPIEEMRIVRRDELDLPPTGDGNNSSSFVCRPVVGSTSWSEHAYGRAVDINPFHNPYVKGEIVLPELASAYVDRGDVRPGMIQAGSPTVAAFLELGWKWGGNWNSLKDHMHFSHNGR